MHWNIRSAYVRLAGITLATTALAILSGCGVTMSTPPTNYVGAVTLQGQVFAARNYMSGAVVKIYATQPTGVATKGTYVGAAKLLTTVTANTTGGWKVTGLSCSSPDMLYVTAEGGTPYPSNIAFTSLAPNPNSLMMTAIGDCSILTSASVSNNVTSIVTNEASTIAAVWALRSFISLSGTTVNVTSSATNYAGTSGVGTPGNFAGLAHAFLNANLLSPYKIGNFVQYTNGSYDTENLGGLVPVQELNSLAYAQYLCTIGGAGDPGDFSYCTTLYQLATPPGGTAPTNSLQAMLNIANNPTYNAQAILTFTLTPIPHSDPVQTGSQQINAGVYVPALTAFGTLTLDWTVAIYYLPPYGITPTGQGTAYIVDLTLDANDNVYISNPNVATGTQGNIIAINSAGRSLWTTPTDTTNLVDPRGIAADALGHIWVVNALGTAGTGFVQELNATNGATIAQFPSSSASLYYLAVDSLGNVWYDANNSIGQNLHELVRSGSTYTEAVFPVPPASPSQTLLQLRPDSNNNIWAAGYSASNAQAVYFPNTGTASAPTYTAGLKFAPLTGDHTYGITPDAAGNAYSVSIGTGAAIQKTTVTGSGASATLLAAKVAAAPVPTAALATRYMDIDGVGNIYFIDAATGTKLYQYNPTSATTAAFYPCFNAGTDTGTGTATSTVQTCATGISTRLDFAFDSTGTMWVGSYGNQGGGRITEIIGVGAPTVPLKSLGKIGVMP